MTNTPSNPLIPKAPKGLRHAVGSPGGSCTRPYDFSECPEKLIRLEEAFRTADVVAWLQTVVDAVEDLRVRASQGQPVAAPEVGELRQYCALLSSLPKSRGKYLASASTKDVVR
ncbi:hypothetical protein MFM001_08650 [Mycobacterium sp. MFM001]|nr:hypothetical protein MFM001_08650 [Mycobacterium sp. MFM001]